jgi:hypothetical protein
MIRGISEGFVIKGDSTKPVITRCWAAVTVWAWREEEKEGGKALPSTHTHTHTHTHTPLHASKGAKMEASPLALEQRQ